MLRQDALRFGVSNQDHTARPKLRSMSQQTEDEEEELPPRLPSSGMISTTEAEDQLTNSQDDSSRSFSLHESPAAKSHTVLNEYTETNHSSSFPLNMQPSTNTKAIPTPSLHTSQQKFSGIQEMSLPMNQTTTIGTSDETFPHFPTLCPTSAQSTAHKPSHLYPRNSKLSPRLQSPRLQYVTLLNASSREAAGAIEAQRRAECNYAYDSEAEEDSEQLSHSTVGILTTRENTDIKSKSSETGEHTKQVEFTKLQPKNQLVRDSYDAPNCHRSAHRLSVNDTPVGKSGSFSIPACPANVTQVRPSYSGRDSQRPSSPGGCNFRRREISPRNFMSAISMISSDSKPSKIPRLVQKSARALAVNGNHATHCDNNRYSVFNVFSIIMMTGLDDRAEKLDSASTPMIAAESMVEENKKCTVFEHRSYLHPAVQKIQTYEPVQISIKPSETASAVISVEEPKVLNTLLNIAKPETDDTHIGKPETDDTHIAKPETKDTHVITVTEFRDAISVYEPVVPTNKLDTTEQTNKDEVISAEPSAEKVISTEKSKQKIVSIIPSVVVASAHVKKQKKSKSVQPKVQRLVQSSVHPVVQSLVQSAVQSSVQPVVQSLVQSAVQSSVQAVVQSSVQSAVQSSVKPAAPDRKTSSLASSITEVSFTDLDKKAFQPQLSKTSSKERGPNSKTKPRHSKGPSRTSTSSDTKTETTSSTSREEHLKSASRSALKAIVKALLASNGVQHPGNQKESSDKGTGLMPPSSTTMTSPFISSALLSSISGPQAKTWSKHDVANSDRTKSGSGENLGQYPLGSSVTQVFSKHRKNHQQLNASENSTSWSKALYAKTLYFKNETKQNPQKQTNPRNPASSMQMPPSKTKSSSSKSERSNEDLKNSRDRFHSAKMMQLKQAANVPSVNSVAEKLEEPYASLERTVNNIILSRFLSSH